MIVSNGSERLNPDQTFSKPHRFSLKYKSFLILFIILLLFGFISYLIFFLTRSEIKKYRYNTCSETEVLEAAKYYKSSDKNKLSEINDNISDRPDYQIDAKCLYVSIMYSEKNSYKQLALDFINRYKESIDKDLVDSISEKNDGPSLPLLESNANKLKNDNVIQGKNGSINNGPVAPPDEDSK